MAINVCVCSDFLDLFCLKILLLAFCCTDDIASPALIGCSNCLHLSAAAAAAECPRAGDSSSCASHYCCCDLSWAQTCYLCRRWLVTIDLGACRSHQETSAGTQVSSSKPCTAEVARLGPIEVTTAVPYSTHRSSLSSTHIRYQFDFQVSLTHDAHT